MRRAVQIGRLVAVVDEHEEAACRKRRATSRTHSTARRLISARHPGSSSMWRRIECSASAGVDGGPSRDRQVAAGPKRSALRRSVRAFDVYLLQAVGAHDDLVDGKCVEELVREHDALDARPAATRMKRRADRRCRAASPPERRAPPDSPPRETAVGPGADPDGSARGRSKRRPPGVRFPLRFDEIET